MGATTDLAGREVSGSRRRALANRLAVTNAAGWSPTDYPEADDSLGGPTRVGE